MQESAASWALTIIAVGVSMSGAYFFGLSMTLSVFPVSMLGFTDYLSKAVDFIPLMGLFIIIGLGFGIFIKPVIKEGETDSDYERRTGWNNSKLIVGDWVIFSSFFVLCVYTFFFRNWYEISAFILSFSVLTVKITPKFVSELGLMPNYISFNAYKRFFIAAVFTPVLIILAFGRGWDEGIRVVEACANSEHQIIDNFELGPMIVTGDGELYVGELQLLSPDPIRHQSASCIIFRIRCDAA